MRNTWARAWLAAIVLLVAAGAIARSRHSMLLEVEEPVMDWLLDGTDTSGWERASALSSPWLIIAGTIFLALVALFLEWKVSLAIVFTSIFATVLASVVEGIVDRPAPESGVAGSFPSTEIVQTGVFWGLVVLAMWWIGAPRLVWQIGLEVAIVIVLLVSINLVVSGENWPSDAVGSALVMAVALILAAIVFEAFAPRVPWLKKREPVEHSVAA